MNTQPYHYAWYQLLATTEYILVFTHLFFTYKTLDKLQKYKIGLLKPETCFPLAGYLNMFFNWDWEEQNILKVIFKKIIDAYLNIFN